MHKESKRIAENKTSDQDEDSVEFGSDGEDIVAEELAKAAKQSKVLGKRNRTHME